jgi:hypothetical protein
MKKALLVVFVIVSVACTPGTSEQSATARPSTSGTSAITDVSVTSATATVEALPLGDGKLSNKPQRGYIFACPAGRPPSGGAHRVGEWIKDGYWYPRSKPIVEGNVRWENASISITVEGDTRIVRANNFPNHPTGEFPIRPGSQAYEYDRNPNRITEQPILLNLPAQPEVATQPTCVPMGMIGFTLTGVAIFNAFDLQQRDAPAYEIQDRCDGHPERTGQYHYHNWSACIPDPAGSAGEHSSLVGFMLDGFPIFGSRGAEGKEMSNTDLDECHGHVGEVEIDGKMIMSYHYHFTKEYPYTIGCFKGAVDQQLL